MAGHVVEHRVVSLRPGLRLGDAPDALVSFPGACLELARDRAGWTLGGHRLVGGRSLSLSLGRIDLRVRLVEADPMPRGLGGLPDPVLLLSTAAFVLLTASVEMAWHTVHTHREAATALQAWIVGASEAEAVPAGAPDGGHDWGRPQWRPAVGLAERDLADTGDPPDPADRQR